MDPFVSQLAALCREYPTRNKWVFVQSHAIGRTLGERIALEGTNWANLRFVTPLEVAVRMAAPFLLEKGLDPSEDSPGPAVIMSLLLQLPEEGNYFASLQDQPTLAEALWDTIRELRMAGVGPDDLPGDAFESPRKFHTLRELLRAYERYLADAKRTDLATVYREALNHPDWCPIQPQDCWTEMPGVIWHDAQRRLIDSMPGERIIPRAIAIPGLPLPRRAQSRSVEHVQPSPASSPLAFLLQPASIDKLPKSITLFHGGGREAEIEEVFRRTIAAGVAVDKVEIACANDACVSMVWEKARRYGWDATVGAGLPVTFTRPGRALLAFCEWVESDFSASLLRRLLQSGNVRLGEDDKDTALAPGRAARLLVKSEAAHGRATYEISLKRLQKSYEETAADPNRSDETRTAATTKAAETGKLRAWIAQVLAWVPLADDDGSVAVAAMADGALAFLENCAYIPKTPGPEGVAAQRLQDAIRELKDLGAFRCPFRAALRFVRERVSGLIVGSERPRAGHLYISSLQQCGFAGRARTFIVGLEEGRVFPSATEDPILLDAERRWNPLLRLSTDRVDEAVWHALSRLAVLGGDVCLSYSSRDLREYRETYASWVMLQAFRVQQADASAGFPEFHKALGSPASCVPEPAAAALSEGGWWLASARTAGTPASDAILIRFPQLEQGRKAAAARATAAFTEYDGYVPEAGKVIDPCAEGNAVSPTALEEAAECGYRYFLKRGLGVDSIEDDERDGDVWLDPLRRGSELHALYAAVLQRARDAKRRPDRAADLPWLLDTARRRLEELRVELPPPTEQIYEHERDELLADLERFLDVECEDARRTAVGLEVPFGVPLDGCREPLAREEPIEVDLGDGRRLRIRGRIDRIDRVEEGGEVTFEVIDYKTGYYSDPRWNDQEVFRAGRRLQHALYGVAAAELLKRIAKKPRVRSGTYYFSTTRGDFHRSTIPAPKEADLRKMLAAIRDLIAEGVFLTAAAEDACKYCDFGHACGAPQAVADAARKLQDPRAAARRRLAEHV